MKRMERITRMLFDGEIHAFESTVPQGLEYQKIQDRYWELMEHIKGRLPEEDAGLFEEWDGLRLDSSTIHEYCCSLFYLTYNYLGCLSQN